MMCASQCSDGLLPLSGATLGQLVLNQRSTEGLSVIDGEVRQRSLDLVPHPPHGDAEDAWPPATRSTTSSAEVHS